MKYIDFRKRFLLPIFTLQDMRLAGIELTSAQLKDWQEKEYLTVLRGGVYLFNEEKDKISPLEVSAVLLEPSCISLETALYEYGLIPEVVFSITAVTPKINREYQLDLGHFTYQHLKSELFFGYQERKGAFRPYLIAEPEKALLDFFYLHPYLKDESDIVELRLNQEVFKNFSQEKIDTYGQVFPQRVQKLIKILRSMNA